MKTEISRVFRKNALVFWRNPIFRENRFFAKFRDKQDNIDLNIVFAAPLSGGSFRPSGPAMRPAPETVRRTRPAVAAAAGRLPYAAGAVPPPGRGRKGVRSGERLLKTNLISK